jgi:hypothetical protein
MRMIHAALAIFVLALAGCPNEPAPGQSPLYFFGDETASDGFDHAGYWNSGSRTNFAQSDANSSDAFSSGSTVYVCGYRKNVGPGNYNQACYWTNGGITALVDTPADDSSALAVRFSGTSLYIAGSLAYGVTGAGYWKDGAVSPLTDGAWATDVVEYGGNTYVFGCYWTTTYVGGYWKIPSSGPTTRHDVAASYGNHVGKGDLHGDTYYLPGKGGYYVIDLGDDSSSFVALPGANVVERIHVNSEGVVRSVGTDSSSGPDKASLWIGTLQDWAETEASEALDVVEYHGKTYVCGLYKNADLEELACYWEDGVRHLLSDKDGSRAHTALLIE